MRLVKVTWVDSGLHLDDGWAPIAQYVAEAIATDATVETVGFLIHHGDGLVIVGLSYDAAHEAVFGAQVIHQSNVVSIDDLHATHPLQNTPPRPLQGGIGSGIGMVP